METKREREREIFLVGEEDEWWRRDVREAFCLLSPPFCSLEKKGKIEVGQKEKGRPTGSLAGGGGQPAGEILLFSSSSMCQEEAKGKCLFRLGPPPPPSPPKNNRRRSFVHLELTFFGLAGREYKRKLFNIFVKIFPISPQLESTERFQCQFREEEMGLLS